jgi:hypothetical protein
MGSFCESRSRRKDICGSINRSSNSGVNTREESECGEVDTPEAEEPKKI